MLHLYNSHPRKGQSFEGVKEIVKPNQSMALAEILRRFIKRESLPAMKEGIYVEGQGDLEKMSKEDIYTRHEMVSEQKKKVAKIKKELDEQKNNSAKASAKKEGSAPASTGKDSSKASEEGKKD